MSSQQEAVDLPLAPDQGIRDLAALSTGGASLDHLATLRIEGQEAASFLHSQFTCDVNALAVGEQVPGAYCNPKGRAIAVFHLLRDEDGFFLLLPEDLADTVVNRLRMFRMRAKAEIDTLTDTKVIGLIGSYQESPSALWNLDDYRSLTFACKESPIVAAAGTERVLYSDYWRLAGILAGDPQVFASTSEAFIPQQINLDLVGGVSFRKGCYPGQEIIARVRYLGRIKQRMIAASLHNDGSSPEPGTGLFTPNRPDQKSGMVVDVVSSGNITWVLAMIPFELLHQGDIHLGSVDGPLLNRIDLPYALDSVEEKEETK